MKSIAEILGWERAPDYDEERWVDPIDHVAWLPGSGYDCDDMLAFLVQRDDIEAVDCWFDLGGCTVRVYHPYQSWSDNHEAPTLHAALEAAVRAVHDAEEAK